MKALRLPLTVVLFILVVLTSMLWRDYSAGSSLDERTQKALDEFERRDANVTRDVLFDRAGLSPSYDTLARDRRDLNSAMKGLNEVSSDSTPAAQSAMAPQLAALSSAVKRRLDDVEHFKAANAQLRKSLRYMPSPGTNVIMHSPDQRTARDAGQLSYDVLRYMYVADPDIDPEIRKVLESLGQVRAPTQDLKDLVRHGSKIVEKLPEADRLLHQIVDEPQTAKIADQLRSVERAYYASVESRTRSQLYLASGLLVALLAYLIHHAARRVTSDLRLRAITESTREAIISVDADGRVQSWNAGATAMFGYSAREMIGRSARTLVIDDHHQAYDLALGRIAAGDSTPERGLPYEAVGRRKSGKDFPIELSISHWESFGRRFATGIIRDVSDKKALEAANRAAELRLIQANRMTTLGTLLTSVAHALKGRAQVIILNTDTVSRVWSEALPIIVQRRGAASDAPTVGQAFDRMAQSVPTLIGDMREVGVKVKGLVDDLLDFARQPQIDGPSSFPLNATVERAVRLLDGAIKDRTRAFRLELASNLPDAHGSAQPFYHVVVNLLGNALESLPDADRGVSVITGMDKASNHLTLIVADEGVGMSAAQLAQLDEQWFSTKRDRGGTGLGVAMTKSLLRAQGGELRYESEPGRGTRATVSIPAVTS